MTTGRELTPLEVLIALFEEELSLEVKPQMEAEVVIQRLTDAGFEIRPAQTAP